MLYQERENYILQQLQLQATVKVSDLSRQLRVSVDTVRRDLKNMEQNGLIRCVRGGAILPSCLSGFLSWFLYSVEVNIRASTIVGMVGGGGVGLTLFSYIKSFQYDVALSIILLIAVMVIAVDQITNKLRKELLK